MINVILRPYSSLYENIAPIELSYWVTSWTYMHSLLTGRSLSGKTILTRRSGLELTFSRNYERLLEISAILSTLKETMRTDGTDKFKAGYLLFDSLDVLCQLILSWIDLESDG
jgi:hypothetical protein